MKKKNLNKRRKKRNPKNNLENKNRSAKIKAEDDEELIQYCMTIGNLINDKPISRERIRELLKMGREAAAEEVRQHSLVEDKKRDIIADG